MMRRTVRFAVLPATVALVAGVALTTPAAAGSTMHSAYLAAGDDDGCWVELFDGDDFDTDDDHYKLTVPGEYKDLDSLPEAEQSWTDEADSLKVGPDAHVTIYPETDFGGQESELTPGEGYSSIDEPSSLSMTCAGEAPTTNATPSSAPSSSTTPQTDASETSSTSTATETSSSSSSNAAPWTPTDPGQHLSGAIETTSGSQTSVGNEVTVILDQRWAGQDVSVWLFSQAFDLGVHGVGDDGHVTVTVPDSVNPGAHTLAAYSGDQELIGSTTVTIEAQQTAGLAETGQRYLLLVFGSLALLLVGGGVFMLSRRRA